MAAIGDYVKKFTKAVNEFSVAYGHAAQYLGPMKELEKHAETIEKENERLEKQAEKMKDVIDKIEDDRQKLAYQREVERLDRLKSANDHKLTDVRARIAVWSPHVSEAKRKMKAAMADIEANATKIEASLD